MFRQLTKTGLKSEQHKTTTNGGEPHTKRNAFLNPKQMHDKERDRDAGEFAREPEKRCAWIKSSQPAAAKKNARLSTEM